ncbi:MAG: hypothetical protein AB7V43_14390 [Acidimicrobiia bacterium]
MPRYLIIRFIENFFRRWWLYVLPTLLMGVVGVSWVSQQKDEYRSDAVIYAESDSFLSELTAVNNAGTSFETPASLASQRLANLLSTGTFIDDIATKAGFEVNNAVETAIRKSVSTWSDGNNLVHVAAKTADPQQSLTLVNATIDSFIAWEIRSNVNEASVAESFYNDLLVTLSTGLNDAQQARTTYVAAHPDPVIGARPLAETIEITRLNDAVITAQKKYDDALAKRDDAQLASKQTETDVTQRFKVVDRPEAPTAPESGKKKTIIGFATYLILGGLLTLAMTVVGTLVDRTIRLPVDVGQRLKVPMLTSLPEVRS